MSVAKTMGGLTILPQRVRLRSQPASWANKLVVGAVGFRIKHICASTVMPHAVGSDMLAGTYTDLIADRMIPDTIRTQNASPRRFGFVGNLKTARIQQGASIQQ